MKKNEKEKLQFSKTIVLITGVIFILTLVYCLCLMKTVGLDLTLGITAITATCGMFGSSIIWYLKKSQAENVIKLRISYIKELSNIEYKTYEKKLRLKQELGLLNCEDPELEESMLDDMYSEAVSSDASYLSQQFDDATSDPEIETI